eukprot:12833889-Ditylum_brightwellii.AAC.1
MSSHATELAKKYDIALPYHIPHNTCEYNNKEILIQLDYQCLEELHKRCLYVSIIDCPIKDLLLELNLQSYGAELSDRFLEKLAMLSSHHDFYIAVDEVLTGGRVEELLLTRTKPPSFLER